MDVKELKELIKDLPDNMEIFFKLSTRIPEDKLANMTYKWPYDSQLLCCTGSDASYSEKVFQMTFEGVEQDG